MKCISIGRHDKKYERRSDKMDKMLRYSIQLAMLKQLLDKELISELEYRKVKIRLMRDYGVVSDLCT